jgi:cation:H+ antiporter
MDLEKHITDFLEPRNTTILLVFIAVTLAVLAKLADIVVEQAVVLSERSGIPKVIVGATIVSLGTTAPEVAVSVLAAFKGNPTLAMGNAVGSIICDTGLILGIACLIRPLTIPSAIANRQGWVQLGSGLLLVLLSIPWAAPLTPWTEEANGSFPRWAGFLFLGLLAVYLYLSVKWSRSTGEASAEPATESPSEPASAETSVPAWLTLVKLFLAIAGVIGTASVLIPAVLIVAERWGVPDSVIALTIVAFGTSLPELVTSVQSARRGHGDLAIGNIIGADVLNALFVAGASAAVSPGGLTVDKPFFWLSFPTMIVVLIVFRIGIFVCKDKLPRSFGIVLLGSYLLYIGLTIATGLDIKH